MLRSGSGAYFSAPESPLDPAGCSAMGCMGLGAGSTWAQPCGTGWSPGAGVLAQPHKPEGGSHPSSARWSPWRGVPAQPQASSAVPEGSSLPPIAGWSPWGGLPAHSSAELGPGSYPRMAGWSPWRSVPAQPHASSAELGGRRVLCSTGWSPWGGVPAHPLASGAAREPPCGASPCSGLQPQPQLDLASQAQVVTACSAIQAFIAAQRGFLTSAAHADTVALEDARLALVAACVLQQVAQDGRHAPCVGLPGAQVGGAAGQAALNPAEATLALERARLTPAYPRRPLGAAQQDVGALAAPGRGARWGTGFPGGELRMRRALSWQRRRAEPYVRGPCAAGLRVWRAAPGGHARAPAGLADPCCSGPCATAMQAGNLAASCRSGDVLVTSVWAVAPCGNLATGARCGYVGTLERGGRQPSAAAGAPLVPVVEAVPAAAASAYARQGVAAAMVAAVLTGGCAAADKAHTGAAVWLDARAGGTPVAVAKL